MIMIMISKKINYLINKMILMINNSQINNHKIISIKTEFQIQNNNNNQRINKRKLKIIKKTKNSIKETIINNTYLLIKILIQNHQSLLLFKDQLNLVNLL